MTQPRPANPHLRTALAALPEYLIGHIIAGTLYVHQNASPRHQHAVGTMMYNLADPFRRGIGGPGGWVFLLRQELHLADDIVVPDLSGWTAARYPTADDDSYPTVAPDWICEIVEPPTESFDRTDKVGLYARNQVPILWYVDLIARTLQVLALQGDNYTRVAQFGDNDIIAAAPFAACPFQLKTILDLRRTTARSQSTASTHT